MISEVGGVVEFGLGRDTNQINQVPASSGAGFVSRTLTPKTRGMYYYTARGGVNSGTYYFFGPPRAEEHACPGDNRGRRWQRTPPVAAALNLGQGRGERSAREEEAAGGREWGRAEQARG